MRHHRLLGIAMFFLLAAILVVPGLIQGAQAKPVAGGGNGDGTGIVVVQSVALTADEVKWLKYLREEEKVARDVYTYLYSKWGALIFKNIAASEQKHMDAIKNLMMKYGVSDPAAGNGYGVFTNQELQVLYDKLIVDGSVSKRAALEVGVLIEELDIGDLEEAMSATTHNDIKNVYSNLLQGSFNHLAAFESQFAKLA